MLSKSPPVAAAAPEGKRGDYVDWREQAACIPFKWEPEEDPFFPTKSGNDSTARYICGRCPARAACLANDLKTVPASQTDGFLGGHTPNERKAMKLKLQRAE